MIKKITISLFVVIICLISYRSISYPSGPPTGMTNAQGENNCTNCHTGSVITSGSDWNTISLNSNFTGNGYIPDSTYTIKIAHSQSGISTWGFEATILDASNNKAGTLSGSGRVQKLTSGSREYVLQTSSGTSSTSTNATEWSFTWKAPSTNVGPVKVFACVLAANSNGKESGDQVFAKTFTIKPSSLIPVADASCVDSLTCAGTTITLKGTSAPTITGKTTVWTWSIKGATLVSPSTINSQNPVVKYVTAGTYWAILSTNNGKANSTKSDSVKIVVRSKPIVSISPNTTPVTICKGDSVKLSANFNATWKYTWTPGGNVSQEIWAKDTGLYTVTATDNNTCSGISNTVRIIHNQSHSISIKRDVTNDTICFERPVIVTASGTAAFDTILYYSSTGAFQRTAVNPQTFKFSTSTDLFAKGKDSKGCITPKSNSLNFVTKTGIAAPKANCTDKTTASFEISWGAVTDALGYKVSLDSGKTWITPSSGNKGLLHKVLSFPSNTDIEVQIKALDIFPCNESEITKVVCGSIPCSPLNYEVVWDKEVCKGNEINFKIKNLNSTFYSLTIDNGKTFKDTAFTITADFNRTYKFELTDSNNLSCPTIKRDATVKVWEIPASVLTSNNPQNIFCDGNPALFDAVSKGMQEYNFYLNNVSKQKSSSPNWNYPTPKNLDSVWVTITNGACVSKSGKIKLGIKPLPTAKFSFTFSGRKATYTANETGKAKFYWDFGDGTKDSIANKTIKNHADSVAFTGYVKLTVVDEFGCTSTDSMEVKIPASIKNTLNDFGIKVYPQPAKNSFKIDIPVELINAQITLMDAAGRIVTKAIADKKVTEITTTELPNGVYMLMITKGQNQFNGKVIISR